ncbi:MAG: hypothetical protein KTR31_17075 [Myxococcales bacterium]|nr:hypothetical protein [Myxococcales bacterium]
MAEPSGRSRVEAELASFQPSSVTVRVLSAILGALPAGGATPWYGTVREAAEAATGGVPDAIVRRAEVLLDAPHVGQALDAAAAIDAGDRGLSVVGNIRAALSLVSGRRAAVLDSQQRADAALKALALAYLITKMLPEGAGSEDRLALLKTIPAGTQLIQIYAAIEVALPFGERVAAAHGRFVAELVEAHEGGAVTRFLSVVGRVGVEDAKATLAELVALLDEAALAVLPHAQSLASRLVAVLPGSSGVAPQVAASGVDALPAYRWLCARLAVESSLALAKLELMPQVALPLAPSERTSAGASRSLRAGEYLDCHERGSQPRAPVGLGRCGSGSGGGGGGGGRERSSGLGGGFEHGLAFGTTTEQSQRGRR